MTQVLDAILRQIDFAKAELDAYPPKEFAWHQRSVETATLLVPWLSTVAGRLKTFIEEVANSKQLVRSSWKQIKEETNIRADLRSVMDRELDRESVLLENVGGDIMSKVVEKFLIKEFPEGHLQSNGRSDYPDLFLRSKDYTGLPTFTRLKDKSKDYGAALKGETKRAVRVPDGLEIKTCKNRFGVDCHHAHAGLHLAVLFSGKKGSTEVFDVLVAFMRHENYRITRPASPTTTLKASFNGEHFVSLLHT